MASAVQSAPMVSVIQSAPIEHKPRTYQSYPGSQYILPSDEEEKARLELQHRVLQRSLDNKLVLAPVSFEEGSKVLDCGTGSGIWLLDFAGQGPVGVKLQGIDIESRLFPAEAPANAEFAVASATDLPKDWENTFQFVHQRLLIAALRASEWPRVLSELFRILKPGGWIELLEAKRWGSPDGPFSTKHLEMLQTLFASRELLIDCSVQIPNILRETGFTNVQTEERHIPAGSWAGEEGIECRDNFINVFRGMKTPILRAGGLGYVKSEEEHDHLVDSMSKEWDEKDNTTVDICVFFAQKPEVDA